MCKLYKLSILFCKKHQLSPQEVAQSTETTPHKAKVTRLNPPSLLLCGHVEKKNQLNKSIM
jgi:hypothetical protein